MRSGGSASPSVVRPAGRPARRSAPRKGTTRATAAVVAEGTPPADTAAADRTPRAVVATRPVVAGIHPAAAGATPADRARCFRRFARSVAAIPRFPSSLARTSRFTAGSASSCGGRRRPRATTTTRTRSSPRRGGHPATPFSIASRGCCLATRLQVNVLPHRGIWRFSPSRTRDACRSARSRVDKA